MLGFGFAQFCAHLLADSVVEIDDSVDFLDDGLELSLTIAGGVSHYYFTIFVVPGASCFHDISGDNEGVIRDLDLVFGGWEVDRDCDYLIKHLQTGQRVQYLEWNGFIHRICDTVSLIGLQLHVERGSNWECITFLVFFVEYREGLDKQGISFDGDSETRRQIIGLYFALAIRTAD